MFCEGRGGRSAASGGHEYVQKISGDSRLIREGEAAVYPVGDASAEEDHRETLEAQIEEEAEAVRPLPSPVAPTRSDFLDHCVTHCPYRSWCRHCVEGRGREFGHGTHKHEARGAPLCFRRRQRGKYQAKSRLRQRKDQ